MATLYTVSDGDPADAADLNQIITALSNVIGVTDTAQLALGRLVIPNSEAAEAPGAPITGQMWMVTDEGVSGGRLYLKHEDDIVPYLPLRQIKRSAISSYEETPSNTYVDTTLSVDIETTGGWLKIYLTPANTDVDSYVQATNSASGIRCQGELRAVVGAQNLGTITFGILNDTGIILDFYEPPGSFLWLYKPAPGSYTVKIQFRVVTSSADDVAISNCYLVVEELGD